MAMGRKLRAYLYMGTHEPGWLKTAGVPLFISHRRLARLETLPKAIEGWALDSGGFSEIAEYGEWRTSAEDYVDAVIRYDLEIGRLEWAAPQDWMCEPDMIAKTGLAVFDHQKRTVANYIELCELWDQRRNTPELVRQHGRSDRPFMPVLQGWSIGDYMRCMELYADAGVDLHNVETVGVGSVCRRQHTQEIGQVFQAIVATDAEIPLHGFGVKMKGLEEYGELLTTADSMA